MPEQQPGEVIIPIERNESTQPPQVVASSPSFDAAPENVPATMPPPSVAPAPAPIPQTPAPAPIPQTPAPIEPEVEPVAQPLTPETSPDTPSQSFIAAPTSDTISWQSAEYLAHDKDSTWYGAMVLGSFLISVIVYILNRDVVTAVIILFALVGLTYFSGRKPREQRFAVSLEGVQVGRNYYAFHDFRSFSVVEDPASVSVVLAPLKRFMPAINIFVPTDYEEKVVSFIATILPFEQRKTDIVDNLMRRIKF